jgi:hypothetical protein
MMKRKRDDDDLPSTDQFDFEDFDEKEHDGQHHLEDALSFDLRMHPSLVDHGLDDHGGLLLKNDNNIAPIVPWTEDEDIKLAEAIDMFAWGHPPTIDWEKVSEHLETHRTAEQCARRWNNALKYRRPEFRPLPWTKQEDDLLEGAVHQYEGQGIRGGIDWEKVRSHVGEVRTVNQCRGRWNGVLKHRTPIVKNSPWTTEEDNMLIQAVGLNEGHGRRGSINWASVSHHMRGIRTAQQCSHRWNRVLKVRGISANSYPWTDEEDERLRQAASEFYGQGLRGGVDWQKVADRLGGERTPQQYGHRWNRVVKFKGAVNKNTPWSPEEDERLLEAIVLYEGQGLRGAVDWGRVCEFMGEDRTAQQCCHRWSGVLKHRGAMKSTPWCPEEDVRLIQGVNLFYNQGIRGGVSWVRVSEYMQRERSCQQCAHRWNRVLRHRAGSSCLNTAEWNDEDDEKLREAVMVFQGQGLRGGVDWGKVADHLGNLRTPQQFCTRWNRVLKNNQVLKPLVWTEADDLKLTNAVNLFRGLGRGGTVDWSQVSDYVGSGRTREQNCGRWNGVLKHRELKGLTEFAAGEYERGESEQRWVGRNTSGVMHEEPDDGDCAEEDEEDEGVGNNPTLFEL